MSLFFDVWANEGFVLASDVRTKTDGESGFAHKLSQSGSNVICAMAVCGDYFKACQQFFLEATSVKDSLREVAQTFAKKWTTRFVGTSEYSAVHLVGYQSSEKIKESVPQMWFWTNWCGPEPDKFHSRNKLEAKLDTFSNPIPDNNHIPHKIRELVGKFPEPTLESEAELVRSFLIVHEPYFTWNGDTLFWRSAASAVGAAMNLLAGTKPRWKIEDIADLTGHCLEFLAKVGGLLPESTVGLSPTTDFDILVVKPEGVNRARWADLDDN